LSDSDAVRRRRHRELANCLKVVDSCLASYYGGAGHMYRPLAGQLRILLCDNKVPLLSRVFPNLKFGALSPVVWLDPADTPLMEGSGARLVVEHPADQEFRLARMPFLITEYQNGLQVADLRLDPNGQMLSLADWMNQSLTVHPLQLSLREVIRSIADRGGGAHVDDTPNEALLGMQRTGPRGVGVHLLFVVALGRFVQEFGFRYTQFVEQFGISGRLQDVAFDPRHPAVVNSARVAKELEEGPRSEYGLTVMARIR
jgi:hypothetical protein